MASIAGTLFSGPISALAKVAKNAMAPAAEAELGALLMNAKEAVAVRHTLEAMGFPQPPAPMKAGSNTANGILSGTMKQKHSKIGRAHV